MSQMRQRWKKRRGGEDEEERKGAGEAETMGGGGRKKRAQKPKTKGEGKERGKDGSLGAAPSKVRRIINEIGKFSGHCVGMGSWSHTAEPECWTRDKLPVNNVF